MTTSQKPKPTITQVQTWLAEQYTAPVVDLISLKGGFWSSAYSYQVDNQAFVLRLSDIGEGFAIDKAAMQFTSPDLPVPEVVKIGEALGHHYAISRRHYGHFIEDAPVGQAEAIGNSLSTLLAALRQATPPESRGAVWYEPELEGTWRDWLYAGLIDKPDSHTAGWRAKLAKDVELEALFSTCVSRIDALLPTLPKRRDLIHGDLLHQNVLVSDDGAKVNAIFSWKCSAVGDFLYDVAWCTFWSPWHPAIAESNIWHRTLTAPDLTAKDLENASLRHHCYELQIAASHFGWLTWTGDDKELQNLANVTERVLARGPLTTIV